MAEIAGPRAPRVAAGDPVAMIPYVIDPMAYEIDYGVVEQVITARFTYGPDNVVVRVLTEAGVSLAEPKTVTVPDYRVSRVPIGLFGEAAPCDGDGSGG